MNILISLSPDPGTWVSPKISWTRSPPAILDSSSRSGTACRCASEATRTPSSPGKASNRRSVTHHHDASSGGSTPALASAASTSGSSSATYLLGLPVLLSSENCS